MDIRRVHPYESVRPAESDSTKQKPDPLNSKMGSTVGHRLKSLRLRCGLSIRKLAENATVTAGMISCIERGTVSPSISTMQKILISLESDLASFFSTLEMQTEGPVYHREKMNTFSDESRSYTFIFPKNPDIDIEMLDETINPSKELPPMEPLKSDISGYLLSGTLVMEIEGQPKQTLRPGDAFYIKKGLVHRGYAGEDKPARVITAITPPTYS